MRLIVENVKKSFGQQQVLKDLNFTFEQGRIYGLLGKNGAGKTTLFNCMSDELKVDEGCFLLEENGQSRALSHGDIGYVYSTPVLPEFMTGYEFIYFYMRINKDKISNVKDVDYYFEQVEMEEADRHKLMRQYSMGMKSKIQIMMVMISQPKVILLDEPLTSLDVVVAYAIKQILLSMKEEHIIIFSTHIMQLAIDLCDDIVVLQDGFFLDARMDKLHAEDMEKQLMLIFEGQDA